MVEPGGNRENRASENNPLPAPRSAQVCGEFCGTIPFLINDIASDNCMVSGCWTLSFGEKAIEYCYNL